MKVNIYKTFALALFCLASSLFAPLFAPLFAQNSGDNAASPVAKGAKPSAAVRLALGNTGPYAIIERSDWSRYENGAYIGHVYREVRASILPAETKFPKESGAGDSGAGSGIEYQGNFFVLEETLRDMRQSARGVDAVIPVVFRVSRGGGIAIVDDKGFPSLRGFPSYPAGAVEPGAKWSASGSRAVDPLNEGRPVVVPLTAEYEYSGTELYRDIPVHRIRAKYASRYQAASSRSAGNEGFTSLQGAHTVDILLRVSDGLPLLMRDNLDETFTWAGGRSLRFRGFTLTFGEGLTPLDREASIAALSGALGGGAAGGSPPAEGGGGGPGDLRSKSLSRSQGVGPKVRDFPLPETLVSETSGSLDITAVPEGIRLTLRDLRFAPDSAELLPGEKARLDAIARALQDFPERSFLVEGHTAAVGRPEGEMRLSLERARSITAELAARGIQEGRFIYKGAGGDRPAADNSTEEGRRMNRRVEITILE
ncbi:MAG: OmpA family protein [Treponema sp.]|jgi:outer membrane protein OmpA-like peptidoglycan-associated protein|nr:OmpA family protein [Treponema sp.]